MGRAGEQTSSGKAENTHKWKRTASQEGRLPGGAVWGQGRPCAWAVEKSKVQISHEEVGVEMQEKEKGDSAHTASLQPAGEGAKAGLAGGSRSLLLFIPGAATSSPAVQFLVQVAEKWMLTPKTVPAYTRTVCFPSNATGPHAGAEPDTPSQDKSPRVLVLLEYKTETTELLPARTATFSSSHVSCHSSIQTNRPCSLLNA